jgi:hypothetical protein
MVYYLIFKVRRPRPLEGKGGHMHVAVSVTPSIEGGEEVHAATVLGEASDFTGTQLSGRQNGYAFHVLDGRSSSMTFRPMEKAQAELALAALSGALYSHNGKCRLNGELAAHIAVLAEARPLVNRSQFSPAKRRISRAR